MAAPLYARYVPPKSQTVHSAKNISPILTEPAENNKPVQTEQLRKRKRESKERKSQKKSKHEQSNDSELRRSEQPSAKLAVHQFEPLTESDTNPKTTNDQQRSNLSSEGQEGDGANEHRKKKKRKLESNGEEPRQSNGEDSTTKHSKIMSKFEKAAKQAAQQHTRVDSVESPTAETHELHDLVPIPVPEQPEQALPQSAYSLLPQWLSKPLSVSADAQKSFEELKVESDLLVKLRKKGFENALPVQTGILPLLLPIPTQHPGDLCVSAATGSGKTLAYVLPVVQSLMRHRTTNLRGVIIVPTRELVDQVRETMEMCISGTSIHVGIAVGTQHLDVEQTALVEKSRRYDPAAYKLLRERLERNLSYEDDDFDDEDELDSAEDHLNLLSDHVPHYTSKVDILIATPGRLVEHIKSTVGFTLANLEWLVIDEADRLLDASFQEWAETLNTAINGPSVRSVPNKLLSSSEFLQRKTPRKIVLSATMTRDLDKLNGLQLKNPKMVVVEGTEEQLTPKDGGEDHQGTEIPPTLKEYGVPIGNGSEKPLFLQCLLARIFERNDFLNESRQSRAPDNSETFSDDNASDESDEESSSSSSSLNGNSDTSESSSDSTESAATSQNNALIFAATNESAHRLSRLLIHLVPEFRNKISTLTKSSTSRSTLNALSSFRNGSTRIIIATDRASRGLDLPNLSNVINYDIPRSANSYVHRVGRTARAGQRGQAWTLVEDREAAWFWKEVAKGGEINRGSRAVERKRLDLKELGDGAVERYRQALSVLEKDVKGNARD